MLAPVFVVPALVELVFVAPVLAVPAFADVFAGTALAAGFVAGLTTASALPAEGFPAALAFAPFVFLAGGVGCLSAPAAGFRVALAVFGGAVLFDAFANRPSLFCSSLPRSPPDNRGVPRCRWCLVYVWPLSAGVQALPQRQAVERFAAENLSRHGRSGPASSGVPGHMKAGATSIS
ncbi:MULTISPECIES: hypothetical protein [unclassified Mesorhizobium]|uniref:hypothetical protein n=1 Tax=unclassified Mesorhizobium TaxID=325217 RepID=UPI001FED3274|nr:MULTISPECIES: hypothetical protein [unclassified Mesorhizobium]